MLTISQSVGLNGANLKSDVLLIQQALNNISQRLNLPPLEEDGIYGDYTENAILQFQKNLVLLNNPDGVIEPGGKSIRKLAQLQPAQPDSDKLIFPLMFRPEESYKTGMRAFGANRSSGNRKHAGVDLYADKGTPIRAVKDGEVLNIYPFYLGTHALEVDHGDMIIRYGEISHAADGIEIGEAVKRGQVIAYVGELVFNSGNKMSMLHLEAYRGTETGPLTNRELKPYQRRADLFDPTSLLDEASMN